LIAGAFDKLNQYVQQARVVLHYQNLSFLHEAEKNA
jgi:hypothetical protein